MGSNPGSLLKSVLLYLVNRFNRIFENPLDLLDPNEQSFSFNIFGVISGPFRESWGFKTSFCCVISFQICVEDMKF